MRELGILYTKENRQKCRDGVKTQTRRLIVPQPEDVYQDIESGRFYTEERPRFGETEIKPRYQVGDHLYLKEPYRFQIYPYQVPALQYKDDNKTFLSPEHAAYMKKRVKDKWISPISLPKFAARTWFEVTRVWVERVQDISELDALAEGVDGERVVHGKLNGVEGDYVEGSCRDGFKALWDSINKKNGFGWDVNPWVWCYEFKLIDRRM